MISHFLLTNNEKLLDDQIALVSGLMWLEKLKKKTFFSSSSSPLVCKSMEREINLLFSLFDVLIRSLIVIIK
jgi:hypothetical protein